jgi:glycosyltransferase involved in cell wall biosynthesis
MNILIVANAFYTKISGGDVIFVQYAKQWEKFGNKYKICTNETGRKFCIEQNIDDSNIIFFKSSFLDSFGVYIGNIIRVISSIINAFRIDYSKFDIIFSASDFLPDIIPAVLGKLKNKKLKWLAALYIFAPNPFDKSYGGNKLRKIAFFVGQKVSLFLIHRKVDLIYTASKFDMEKFFSLGLIRKDRVMAIRGGIDFKFISNTPDISIDEKTFEAVFMGRLHPQKCVDDLIHIWKKVCEKQPDAKLIIIGSGPEEHNLRKLVSYLNLNKNIHFFGTLINIDKFNVIKSAKIFISASRFDSSNIALDESIACRLPGIIYDLPMLYYPKGVIKIPVDNQITFANEILRLLNDSGLYRRLSMEAYDFARTLDWSFTAKKALDFIENHQ